MADVEEGAATPNQRQGQNQQPNQFKDRISKISKISSNRIKMQQDNDIYIYTGLIFKPEFSGKSEDDWMNAHHFHEDMKVHRFCPTLLGEARLWFQSTVFRKYNMATVAKFI